MTPAVRRSIRRPSPGATGRKQTPATLPAAITAPKAHVSSQSHVRGGEQPEYDGCDNHDHPPTVADRRPMTSATRPGAPLRTKNPSTPLTSELPHTCGKGPISSTSPCFAGREFVVVYSDFLEALGPDSPEMKFVLRHEIGHIQSRHIMKQIFLAPGMFFPLIGPAYRRAWETSCDRYGAFAAQDVDAAIRAMLVITGGREHGRTLNAAAFAEQHRAERGFFVSLHELTSTYPTLSRRVVDLMALSGCEPSRSPRIFSGQGLPEQS